MLGDCMIHKNAEICFVIWEVNDFKMYCLQDTHFTDKMEPYIRAEWGWEAIFNSHTSNARGVCILFSNFEYKIHKIKRYMDGNSLILDIEIEGRSVKLINLYRTKQSFTRILSRFDRKDWRI